MDSRPCPSLLDVRDPVRLITQFIAHPVTPERLVSFGDKTFYSDVRWVHASGIPLSAVASACAQSFFAWRCFTLTKRKWYVLAGIGGGMSFPTPTQSLVSLILRTKLQR